jgi:hypothetical protein
MVWYKCREDGQIEKKGQREVREDGRTGKECREIRK